MAVLHLKQKCVKACFSGQEHWNLTISEFFSSKFGMLNVFLCIFFSVVGSLKEESRNELRYIAGFSALLSGISISCKISEVLLKSSNTCSNGNLLKPLEQIGQGYSFSGRSKNFQLSPKVLRSLKRR